MMRWLNLEKTHVNWSLYSQSIGELVGPTENIM
jgi:hypothetical protein